MAQIALGDPNLRLDNVGHISNLKTSSNSDDTTKSATMKTKENPSNFDNSPGQTEVAKLKEQLTKCQNEFKKLTAETKEVKNQLDSSNAAREKLKVRDF